MGNLRNFTVESSEGISIVIEEININGAYIDTLYINGILYFLTIIDPSFDSFSKAGSSITFRLLNNNLSALRVFYELDNSEPSASYVDLEPLQLSDSITISDISIDELHRIYARGYRLEHYSPTTPYIEFTIYSIPLTIIKDLDLILDSTVDLRTPKSIAVLKELGLTLDSVTDLRTPKGITVLQELDLTLNSDTRFPYKISILKELDLALDSVTDLKTPKNLSILKELSLTLDSTVDLRTPVNLSILKELDLVLSTDTRLPYRVSILKELSLALDSTISLKTPINLSILKELSLNLDSTVDLRTPKGITVLQELDLTLDSTVDLRTPVNLSILKEPSLTLDSSVRFPYKISMLKELDLTLDSTVDLRTPKGITVLQELDLTLDSTVEFGLIYFVTYYLNGGTNNVLNVDNFYEEDLPITLYDPTKTGYTFVDWYTEAAFTNVITSLTLEQDYSLYAKWQAKTYTVNLDKQGGTGGSNSITATYDSAMPAITLPTYSGYIFRGYFDETSGSGNKYYSYDGSSAKNWDKDLSSNGTLYAYWQVPRATTTPNITDYGVRLISDELGNFNQFYWKVQNLDSLSATIYSEHTDTDPDVSRGTIASNAKTGEITYTTSTSITSITVYAKAVAENNNESAIDSQVIEL